MLSTPSAALLLLMSAVRLDMPYARAPDRPDVGAAGVDAPAADGRLKLFVRDRVDR